MQKTKHKQKNLKTRVGVSTFYLRGMRIRIKEEFLSEIMQVRRK
jgi:hypothetical protein